MTREPSPAEQILLIDQVLEEDEAADAVAKAVMAPTETEPAMDRLTKEQWQAYFNTSWGLQELGLYQYVTRPFDFEKNRTYYWCTAGMLDALTHDPRFRFWSAWNHRKYGACWSGWRENIGTCSMQIAMRVKTGVPGRVIIDVDYDEENPLWDVVTMVRHGWRALWHALRGEYSNPFVVREMLRERRGWKIPGA